MNLNDLTKISTQRIDRSIHTARIHEEHINHIVASEPDRVVGKCVLTMAAGLAGGSVLWPTDELDRLALTFRNLTAVKLFHTASGTEGGRGLVNMERVALVEDEGSYATLSFTDGDSLNIVKNWQ